MNIKKGLKEFDNVWYHYKSFIIMGLLAIVMILSFLPSFSLSKETALRVVFIGNYVNEEERISLQEAASEQVLGERSSTSKINMEFWVSNNPVSLGNTVQKKLMAMIASESVDILVMDKRSFTALADQGTFTPLDSMGFAKDVLYAAGEPRAHHVGIEIYQNKLLEEAGYQTDGKVLGIISNSANHEKAVALSKWVTQSN